MVTKGRSQNTEMPLNLETTVGQKISCRWKEKENQVYLIEIEPACTVQYIAFLSKLFFLRFNPCKEDVQHICLGPCG